MQERFIIHMHPVNYGKFGKSLKQENTTNILIQ